MEFELIRSKRKTIAITISAGKVIVRGPLSLTEKRAARIVEEHKDWIDRRLNKSKEKFELENSLSDREILELKKSAKAYFESKTKEYAHLMNLKYGRIIITSAKTRYGSCSSKGNICFSYRLMLRPEPAREYVIVHELSHLLEMNHSKKFYAIIEKYMPDYKDRKKLL